MSGVRSDITEIVLIGGNWAPLVAFNMAASTKGVHATFLAINIPQLNQWLETLGIICAILASVCAVTDHCMKIHWKIKQKKKDRDNVQ